ncbi:uncharacterized protein LOC116083747 isoform X2 [Mastomys coucha]|uniref:uncharacterized protein LOC116083747 isoform X2 n=1 Tax=Mastomys coucha TaxID=35658 RepID=UPI0012619367|nr:uncharacterized protein LOC116083747 isoform X2 [Mastomys coucha]
MNAKVLNAGEAAICSIGFRRASRTNLGQTPRRKLPFYEPSRVPLQPTLQPPLQEKPGGLLQEQGQRLPLRNLNSIPCRYRLTESKRLNSPHFTCSLCPLPRVVPEMNLQMQNEVASGMSGTHPPVISKSGDAMMPSPSVNTVQAWCLSASALSVDP